MMVMERERTPNPWFDVLVAVGLFAITLGSLADAVAAETPDYGRAPDAINYVILAAMTLPLAWRRRFPASVLAIVSMAFVVDRLADYPITVGTWAIPIALHAVGSELEPERSRLVAWTASGILVAFTVLGVLTQTNVDPSTIVVVAAVTVFPYLLGREVYQRRTRTATLERRAEELEERQQQRAEEAVRRERSRIARELHDVVAHEMTVMTIQAAAARRMFERDPDKAERALGNVEQSGHAALDEMRRLLGVLRTDDKEASRRPQPGLAALDELVGHMQDAGLHVDLSIDGAPQALAAGIDLNVYRIIQESLTNALKHGGPHTNAVVKIAFQPTSLAVEVVDDGRGASALATGNGSGQGHVGMRERTSMLDGELTIGPRIGGGYRVAARIPLDTT